MKEFMEKVKSFVLADETLEKVSGGSGSVSNCKRISSSCVGCGICEDKCPGGCIRINTMKVRPSVKPWKSCC